MGDPKSHNAILVVNISENQRVELKCRKGEIIIGRSSLSDLILPDLSISRKHARVVGTDYGFFIEDLSKNGTFIQGKRIARDTLVSNTNITIGPYLLHFRLSPVQGDEQDEIPTATIDEHTKPHGRDKKIRSKTAASMGPADIGMIGKGKEIVRMFHLMEKVAGTDFPVLISGETGSGKELVARGIHMMSGRRSNPFVALNCSAISSGLVESELFGHEKGAFTGAQGERKGAFEITQGGTLFLDEIGEMPPDIQPKLLRALEESEIKRVGSNDLVRVNVRVIAATNREIRDEIARSKFRKDLYYRLNVFPITVPPLRERKRDIELLAHHFLGQFMNTCGTVKKISKKGLSMLATYSWPGNIRELKNVINRASILTQGETIDEAILKDLLSDGDPMYYLSRNAGSSQGFLRKIDHVEKEAIINELHRTKWNKTRAAKNLGISKSTLFEKLRRYEIKSSGIE